MRAAQITSLDGPDAVQVVDLPEPVAADGQVLLDVTVAGVSFPDVLQSRGEYQMKPPLPYIPGAEVAGVVRVAPAGGAFHVGQAVAAFPVVGGFAQQVAVDPQLVFALPEGVTPEVGAALPMNYLTCHFALTKRGRLAPGETVLVHGAAGGIGTAAIQLAKALDARVIAVVSSDDKERVAREAGADEVVRSEGFKDAVAELTSGKGVDIVVDPVGGDRFTDSLRSLRALGRMLVIGFTGGSIPEVKVNRLLLNNIDVVGVGWGAYWMTRLPYLQEQWAEIVPLLEAGTLDPVLGSVFDLDEIGAALHAIDSRQATGKVLLRP
jgi:NADPH2:quinone reductase